MKPMSTPDDLDRAERGELSIGAISRLPIASAMRDAYIRLRARLLGRARFRDAATPLDADAPPVDDDRAAVAAAFGATAGMSDAAYAQARRALTRDAAPRIAKGPPAPKLGHDDREDVNLGFESDAGDNPDFDQSPGQIEDRTIDDRPRFRPEASERERLPRTVTAEEQRSRYDDLHYDEPSAGFRVMGEGEDEGAAIARLNRGNENHYGSTGEDGDGVEYVGPDGRDPTPRRMAPPPRHDRENWVAENYGAPVGAEPREEPQPLSYGTRRPNRTPYVSRDYPSGPEAAEPSGPGTELFGSNFGTATTGYPRSDDPMKVRPDRFVPKSAGVSSDAASLRELNNRNRRRYGDRQLFGALPRPQHAETSTEAFDHRVHVRAS
jgi:hypothetical protein